MNKNRLVKNVVDIYFSFLQSDYDLDDSELKSLIASNPTELITSKMIGSVIGVIMFVAVAFPIGNTLLRKDRDGRKKMVVEIHEKKNREIKTKKRGIC